MFGARPTSAHLYQGSVRSLHAETWPNTSRRHMIITAATSVLGLASAIERVTKAERGPKNARWTDDQEGMTTCAAIEEAHAEHRAAAHECDPGERLVGRYGERRQTQHLNRPEPLSVLQYTTARLERCIQRLKPAR